MNHNSTLLKAGRIASAFLLVFGLTGARVSHAVDHSKGYKAMSMKDDLAHRSTDIHWPAGFEPENADLFAHNDLIINASCERIWKHVIEASRWPIWYPNSKDVEIPGRGSRAPGRNGVPLDHIRLSHRKQSARVCIEPTPRMVRICAGSQAELLFTPGIWSLRAGCATW